MTVLKVTATSVAMHTSTKNNSSRAVQTKTSIYIVYILIGNTLVNSAKQIKVKQRGSD